ncbi:MAG: hypothetical protein V4563_14995 [Pseudomonadota bacterium]
MSTADDAESDERNQRVLQLSQTILKAAQSLELEQWQMVESHCREGARMARVLKMLDAKSKQA